MAIAKIESGNIEPKLVSRGKPSQSKMYSKTHSIMGEP
jgi:hypothetical protein